jgi:hypothetical protein
MAIVNDPHPLTLKHLREWAVEDDIAATSRILASMNPFMLISG